MRFSAALLMILTLALLPRAAFSQQTPSGEGLGPMFDPGVGALEDPITGGPVDGDPDDPMTDEDDADGEPPTAELPGDDMPEGEPEDDEALPGETPGEEESAESVAGAWLLDFPEADTPWQSDGTTFTSETCTWSEVFPLLAEVSLIAGPIECTDGILPTFGFGIISEGEMSAVAIRLLWIFPIVTPFEGELATGELPGEEEQPPAGEQPPGGEEPPADEEESPPAMDEDADETPPAAGQGGVVDGSLD